MLGRGENFEYFIHTYQNHMAVGAEVKGEQLQEELLL